MVGEWLGQHRLLAFENDLCGSGEFNLRVLDDGGLDLEHHDGARVTDIDNDGDLDVISNGWRNDLIPRIYENTTIQPSDDRPIADAGEDRTVLPGSITLTGSGSDPDGGDIVTYLWTQQSGPTDATLGGETTVELMVDDLVEGVYVFRLTVTDDEGDIGFDEVTVNVSSQADVNRINAGGPIYTFAGNTWAADQYSNGGIAFTKNTPIANTENDQLYQTERYRDDGTLIYEIPVANGIHNVNLHFAEIYWGLPGNGSDGGAGSRLFNIDIEGQSRKENYDIFIEAGGAATAIIESFTDISVADQSLTITLEPITDFPKISGIEISMPMDPSAPTVNAGIDQTITLPTNSIVLSGSGVDSSGGPISSFAWIQESGPNTASLSGIDTSELSVSDMVDGVYIFRLTVTDEEGRTAFDQATVTVLPEGGNQPPVALASATPTTGMIPLEVNFIGSNSTDDIGIETYLWDFKDGTTSMDADPTHTFSNIGTYDVDLTVTDSGGLSNSTTLTIIVTEVDNGEKMGAILEKNPATDGVVTLRVLNQPDNFVMLGINLHDQQGRVLGRFRPDEIIVQNNSYQVPVYTLRDGLYFLNIATNQGETISLKVLVKN